MCQLSLITTHRNLANYLPPVHSPTAETVSSDRTSSRASLTREIRAQAIGHPGSQNETPQHSAPDKGWIQVYEQSASAGLEHWDPEWASRRQ